MDWKPGDQPSAQRVRQLQNDCVEFVMEDGTRFVWSESNCCYECVHQDGSSFTLMRRRLADTQRALKELWDATVWGAGKTAVLESNKKSMESAGIVLRN